jgi:hypothetical protein
MPVIESGNTDVGLRAGEFIVRNREMALRQALAAQEAQRDMARLQLQREQMIQQQRAASDEAMRRDAANAAEMNYRYAALQQSGEQSALERQARAEESAASRKQALELTQAGWTKDEIRAKNQEDAANKRYIEEQKAADIRLGKQLDAAKTSEERQIIAQEKRDNKQYVRENSSKGIKGLSTEKSLEENMALVAEQSQKLEEAKEQRHLSNQMKLIDYQGRMTPERIEDNLVKMRGMTLRDGETPAYTPDQLRAYREDQYRKLGQAPIEGVTNNAPAERKPRAEVGTLLKSIEQRKRDSGESAAFYRNAALESRGSSYPTIAKLGSFVLDVADPTGQAGAGLLLQADIRSRTREFLKKKHNLDDVDIADLETAYADAYVPSKYTREKYGWQDYTLPPLR